MSGITAKKEKDFSEWYTQVIQKAELIEYSQVSGCIILRPYSYEIWEKIQEFFNKEIKKMGIKNTYFPLLIPESLFKKEKEHVKGFTPEVAWVTQAGNTKLNEKLAIRPTSETIMYDTYKKWIRSYKDLPLKLNQWCNVIRWEFEHPVPFLRTREFLWQEGHTAFAKKQEAEEEALQILNLYTRVYQDLYAIPVLQGKKSEKEKFAGAVYTLSIETMLPNGKAIQCATSHFLGQNFSKAFDISFLDENNKNEYVYQNSWGLTTRSIGIMLAIHGDDKGLILPPKIAPIQVIIIPILFGKNKEKILKKCKEIKKSIKSLVEIDENENYTPGWKFNYWELKGVPIRLELGPKDLEKKQVVLVRRDTNKKETVKFADINKKIQLTLEDIQKNLLKKAELSLKSSIKGVKNFEEFKKAIKEKKIVYAPWCSSTDCEEGIKHKTEGVKSLTIPLKQEKIKGKCIHCNKEAQVYAYFGKSY